MLCNFTKSNIPVIQGRNKSTDSWVNGKEKMSTAWNVNDLISLGKRHYFFLFTSFLHALDQTDRLVERAQWDRESKEKVGSPDSERRDIAQSLCTWRGERISQVGKTKTNQSVCCHQLFSSTVFSNSRRRNQMHFHPGYKRILRVLALIF